MLKEEFINVYVNLFNYAQQNKMHTMMSAPEFIGELYDRYITATTKGEKLKSVLKNLPVDENKVPWLCPKYCITSTEENFINCEEENCPECREKFWNSRD